MKWDEAADLIIRGMDGPSRRSVTTTFARLMVQEGEKNVRSECSQFAEAIIKHF